MKLAVLIPTRGTLFTATAVALLRELKPYDYELFFTVDLPIPDCRNYLAEQALKTDATHLLWIDDDVVLPVGGLKAMLSLDQPVVLIDYPTHWLGKGAKTGNIAYDGWLPGKPTDNLPILWGGLGCTLVKREVFDRLEKPYFRRGGQMFDILPNGKKVLYGVSQGGGGEDYEFYYDCRQTGIPIVQVRGMVAGHAKVMRHVGIIESGKYQKQHDIRISDEIERPIK